MTGRSGFALPLVLATAAAALLIVLASTATTWRAYRGSRAALAAANVDLAAERALVAAAELSMRDSLSSRALFDTVRSQFVDADGLTLAVTVFRPSPFVAWMSASASEGNSANSDAARALRTRAMRLRAPALPLFAALTTSSDVDSLGAQLFGSLAVDASGCEGDRGTQMPAVHRPMTDSLHRQVGVVWTALSSRAAIWRGDAPNDGRWRVATLPRADSVMLGPHRWQGLLLHEGPLRVVGDLSLNGVLIVRGPFDARDARLSVLGALIVEDSTRTPTRLGPARIQWDRCAITMALSAVSPLVSAPFDVWLTVTP